MVRASAAVYLDISSCAWLALDLCESGELYGSCPAGVDEQAAIVSTVSKMVIPALMSVRINFISVECSRVSLTQFFAGTHNSMFGLFGI